MIAFDANMWIARFDPSIRHPIDPSNGQPVTFAQERVSALIKEAGEQKESIIIPTPVLSEVLAFTDERRYELIEMINKSAHLTVAPFDMKAAVELAEMNLELQRGEKVFADEAPYQKQKIDRQIVAICKVHQGTTLYTTDKSQKNFALRFGLEVKHLADIPIPEEARQMRLLD